SYSTSPVNTAERICRSAVVVASAGMRCSGSLAATETSPPRHCPSARRTPAASLTPPPAEHPASPAATIRTTGTSLTGLRRPLPRRRCPNTTPPYAPATVRWPTPERGLEGGIGKPAFPSSDRWNSGTPVGEGTDGENPGPAEAVGGQGGPGGVGAAAAVDAAAGVGRGRPEVQAPHRRLGPGQPGDGAEDQLLVELGGAAVDRPAHQVGVG